MGIIKFKFWFDGYQNYLNFLMSLKEKFNFFNTLGIVGYMGIFLIRDMKFIEMVYLD